jgi:uncharacterized protein YjbI with pentapeptide repeats
MAQEHRSVNVRLALGSLIVAAGGIATAVGHGYDAASSSVLVGLLGVAFERFVTLSEHILGHDLHHRLSESALTPATVFRNHDLTMASVSAFRLAMARESTLLPSSERRATRRIARRADKMSVWSVDDSRPQLHSFTGPEVSTLLTSWTTVDKSVALLTQDAWVELINTAAVDVGVIVDGREKRTRGQELMARIGLPRHLRLSTSAVRTIGCGIDNSYQIALREVLKSDFESGGKAYAGLQMLVWGELLAICHEIRDRASSENERIAALARQQKRDVADLVATVEHIARHELMTSIRQLDLATFTRHREVLQVLQRMDSTLSAVASDIAPAIKELLIAVGPVDPSVAWRRYAKRISADHLGKPMAHYPYAAPRRPIRVRCRVNNQYTADLEPALVKYASEVRTRPALLIGEYGQGKSVACGLLAYQLTSAFLADTSRGVLPVIIPCRDITSIDTLAESVESVVRSLYGTDFDHHAFRAARAAGRLFFILDGLDELMCRRDEQDLGYCLSVISQAPLFDRNGLIITTRPNVIEGKDIADSLPRDYEIYRIEPLTARDAKRYLRRRGLDTLLNELSSVTTRAVRDLISRPLFLSMIDESRALLRRRRSAKDLTEAELFEMYVRRWYRRELEAMGRRSGDLTYVEIESLLGNVAITMSRAQTDTIWERDLESLAQQHVSTNTRIELHRVWSQTKERLILVPEFRASGRHFTFRHSSLRSYFVARQLFNTLGAGTSTVSTALSDVRLDDVALGFFLAMAIKDPIVTVALTDGHRSCAASGQYPVDESGALLVAWGLHTRSFDTGCLRAFCAGSSADTRHAVLSSLEGLDLSEADLSFVDLSGVNLRDAKLRGTNLSGSDLSRAILDGADMQSADLSRTKIVRASLKGSNLTGACLNNVTAARSAFCGVFLPAANLVSSRFVDVDFRAAVLNGTDCVDAVFIRTTFASAQMHGCEVTRAVFDECDLSGTELFGTSLVGAIFTGTSVERSLRD